MMASEKASSISVKVPTGAKPRVRREEPLNNKASYQVGIPTAQKRQV
jgi:hypothetical protein